MTILNRITQTVNESDIFGQIIVLKHYSDNISIMHTKFKPEIVIEIRLDTLLDVCLRK